MGKLMLNIKTTSHHDRVELPRQGTNGHASSNLAPSAILGTPVLCRHLVTKLKSRWHTRLGSYVKAPHPVKPATNHMTTGNDEKHCSHPLSWPKTPTMTSMNWQGQTASAFPPNCFQVACLSQIRCACLISAVACLSQIRCACLISAVACLSQIRCACLISAVACLSQISCACLISAVACLSQIS